MANVVKIEVTAQDRASAALKGLRSNIDQLGGRLTSMGATALKATAALGAVGIAAGAAFGVAGVKSAADFEEALSRSIGLASLLPEEVDKVRDALLKLAPEVGKGPQELAEAFYFASSAGLDTAKAMAAVESSAKAAAAGMGETKVIVDAVTSVMNAYGLAADQASRVTDALVNTVKLGKGEPEDLAASIGRVIPVAAEMGVSIEEVGASMAVMTRIGLDADESATALRGSLVALLKPSSTAETALAKIGKSAAGLRQEIKTKGLAATLVDLMDALGGNEEALVDIFPEVRALTGVLATAGNQSEEYIKVLDEMNDGLGATDDAFAEASDTFTFKMSQLKSSFDVLKIKVGNELLPVLKRFADWLIDIQPKIQAFGSEVRQRVTPALQAFGNWFETTGLPALQAFADSMATNLGPAFSDLRTWLTNDLVPKLQEFGEALGPKLQGAIENIGPVLGTMASGFQDIAKAVGDFLGSKIISDPAFIAAAIAIALAPLAIGIATNPVGLAIAGIGALALALGLFSQKIDEQPEPMLKWRKGILEFRRDLGQLEVDIIDFAQTMTTKPISVALNVVLPGVGPLLDEAAKGLNELAKKGIGIPQEMEDIDAELADVQARLDTFSTQRSVDALDDLKKSGDKVPQTFATMADTTIASMIDLNQMTTAPIRGDIDKLTTGANLARDAAGKMAGAWDQALRDSTADFQAIARQIDEQSARLQSLPWTPPTRPMASIPSGTRSADSYARYAEGGTVFGKQTALVGEKGPELVELPTGTRVHSNKDTRKMLGGVRAMQDGGVVGRPKSFQTAEAEGYPPNFTTPSAETRLEAFLHLIARNLPLGPLGKMLADKIRIQMVTTPGSMAAFVPSTYSVFNPPGAGYGYTAIDVRQAALDMAGGGSFLGAVNKLGWLLRHELTHAFVDFYHSLTETLDFAGLASSGIPGSVVRGPWGESSTQLERLKQLASSDPQHVPTQILDALPLTAGLRDLPEKLRSFFDGFLAYKQGGIVPGPLGKPQLGLLHGGEEVIPAGHRGEATVNNLQMHVTINGTSEEALTKFERLFNEMLRRAGYGGSSVSAGAFIPA